MKTRQHKTALRARKGIGTFEKRAPSSMKTMTRVTRRNKVCKAASFHLYNIRRIRKYLTGETTQSLVYAIVMGRTEYCNSFLFNTPVRPD